VTCSHKEGVVGRHFEHGPLGCWGPSALSSPLPLAKPSSSTAIGAHCGRDRALQLASELRRSHSGPWRAVSEAGRLPCRNHTRPWTNLGSKPRSLTVTTDDDYDDRNTSTPSASTGGPSQFRFSRPYFFNVVTSPPAACIAGKGSARRGVARTPWMSLVARLVVLAPALRETHS
jgi:hypothetical protein